MTFRVLYYNLFATTALSCLLLLSHAANFQSSTLIPPDISSGRSLQASTCPLTCANGATCKEGRCICARGYFGPDCSERATELMNNDASGLKIPSNGWAYFYFQLDQDKEVKFSIDYSISPINAAVIFSGNAFTLPPTPQNSYSYMNSPSSRSWQITISNKEAKQHIGQDVLIGLYNPNPQDNDIRIKASTSGSNTLTIVLIVIGVLSVILNIVGCVYYIKYKMRRELLAALREQAAREERANNFSHNLNTHFGNIRIQNFPGNNNNHQNGSDNPLVDLDASLTQEDLNMYFPQTKFESLKTPFGQAECPICLEEYPKDSMCRQLYCDHIFHTNCIQFWLAKHKACPTCKKSMNRMAIGEFYEKRRNQKPRDENEEERRAINQPEPEEGVQQENRAEQENNNIVIDIGQALRISENPDELNVEEEKENQSHRQTQNVLSGKDEELQAAEVEKRMDATHLEVVHLSADKKDEEPNVLENAEQVQQKE